MTNRYIFGNWKMHGARRDAEALTLALRDITLPDAAHVAIFPPFTMLSQVSAWLENSEIALGGQDCSPESSGAFTGDISAAMLRDAGCRYVLLGHSERRTHHHEASPLIRRKAEAALKAGLMPVLCIGEELKDRESGTYLNILKKQLHESLPPIPGDAPLYIAYEPVWAIGTGKTPTLEEIAEAHKTIASATAYATSGRSKLRILYGGSVKASNARDILRTDGVDGVLVGGASLKAEEFAQIIAAAA